MKNVRFDQRTAIDENGDQVEEIIIHGLGPR